MRFLVILDEHHTLPLTSLKGAQKRIRKILFQKYSEVDFTSCALIMMVATESTLFKEW